MAYLWEDIVKILRGSLSSFMVALISMVRLMKVSGKEEAWLPVTMPTLKL